MIFIPPFMLPPPRKTKEQLMHEHKQDMGKTIMAALAKFQHKEKKRGRNKRNR